MTIKCTYDWNVSGDEHAQSIVTEIFRGRRDDL